MCLLAGFLATGDALAQTVNARSVFAVFLFQIINTGFYIMDIPHEALRFCDANDFPLLTVPWEIYLADMIKERYGAETTLITDIGPIIGAHSGPGTIALFFIGDHR